jgi:hypothetical protein
MSDYQLATSDPAGPVLRTADQAWIPADPANRDYNGDQQSPGYLQWLALGNKPDPYVPPPEPTPEVKDPV